MLSAGLFLIAFVLTAWGFALRRSAKWRERARAAEDQNARNRKAHAIQNDIARDPAYRERVRRTFDRP
ncbi:MAG: hypothetical protein H6869_09210 [Rhodospirillales bacterium]|nr:hypothetical protein [Rhodospirillales bacterium]